MTHSIMPPAMTLRWRLIAMLCALVVPCVCMAAGAGAAIDQARTFLGQLQAQPEAKEFARIAREADNVVFLRVEVLESGDTRQIAKELNITKFPTYQYWKVRARSHGPIKRPNRAPHQFNSPN